MLGTTDISGVGDGTVTGALSQINSNLENKQAIIKKVSIELLFDKYWGDGGDRFAYCDYDFGRNVNVISVVGIAGSWAYLPVGATRIEAYRIWRFSSRNLVDLGIGQRNFDIYYSEY